MNSLARRICIFLFAFTLVACAQATPERIEGMINSGDEIDGQLFTTIDEMDWNISLSYLCDWESLEETDTSNTVSCIALPGNRVYFGNCWGIAYDTPQEADEHWGKMKIDVTFDGQVVNSASFGFQDIAPSEPGEQYIRMWNLVVENITPGIHTVECHWEDEGESGGTIYNFTVSDQPETFQTLSGNAPARINPYTSEKANLNYLLYLPGEYGVDPERKWPLLLYLHGMDRVNTSVKVLKNDYPLNTLANQDYYPFIVVAPQGTGEYEFWATDEMDNSIMTLLDEIQGILSLDPNRIYLTGVSAGGNGTWEIGVRHPERFAALAPVMGYYGWPFTVPENICDLVDVPVWAFHGAKDELIPLEAEQDLVDALIACGGDAQITVFPDAGHGFKSEQVYTSELYTWLLSHELK
jgi:predicted esterase